MHERDAHLGALLVTERERFERVITAVSESHDLEQLVGATRCLRLVDTVQSREVHDLLAHLHLWVQAAFFWHVAEAGPVGGGNRFAVEQDLTLGWLDQPEDCAHRGGFTSTVCANESRESPRFDVEAHVVENLSVPVPVANASDLKHAHPFSELFAVCIVTMPRIANLDENGL